MSSILMEIMENTAAHPRTLAPDDGCGRPPRVGDTGRRSAAARTFHRRARPGRSRRGPCGRCRRHRRSLARGVRRLPCGRGRQRPAGRRSICLPGAVSRRSGRLGRRRRWVRSRVPCDGTGAPAGRLSPRLGIVAGGVAAYRAAGHPVGRQHAVPADRVLRDLESGGAVLVDAREDDDWVRGHVPGSLHVPLRSVAAAASILPQTPVVVACTDGRRAATAASILRRRGHANVWRVAGAGVPYLLNRRLDLGGL